MISAVYNGNCHRCFAREGLGYHRILQISKPQHGKELGVESLGLVETFASLEHLLGVEIPDKQAMRTKNIQELVALINT